MNVTVLLSGGVDSTACLAYFIHRDEKPAAVFIDYGQPTAHRERESARSVANWYGVTLTELCCRGNLCVPAGEIPARNAFLIFAAILLAGSTSGLLAIGVHGGTDYYDCSLHFVTSINALLAGYTNGRLTLSAPFVNWDKKMVWDFAQRENAPTNLTWSCEAGPTEPCHSCKSCLDLETLRART